MPYPKKGESIKDYVSRAIPIIKQEHPDLSQAAAVGRAYGMFRTYKKKKRKKTAR